jgi:membrane protease YdiL (CAAX protease family)
MSGRATRSFAEHIDEALRLTGRLVAFALTGGVVFFLMGMLLKPVFPDGLPMGQRGRLLYEIIFVAALGVAHVVLVALAERGEWKRTGLGARAWSPVAIVTAFSAGAFVTAIVPIASLIGGTADVASWGWPPRDVLTFLIGYTLAESLALRGYVIGKIAALWGALAAICLTALIATLLAVRGVEISGIAALQAFALAAFLGAVRLRTGSVVAAWLAQLGSALAFETLGGNAESSATAGVLAVVTFLLLLRMRPRAEGPGRA